MLFDKHYEQQNELVDEIAERIQLLGGVSIDDVAATTLIPRVPKGREEVPVQISRLLHAHEIVLKEARTMARLEAERGDDGTNDSLVSQVKVTQLSQRDIIEKLDGKDARATVEVVTFGPGEKQRERSAAR